jgi:hypothetical protein
VRTFDDPATWTEPGIRHLAANGLGGEAYRTSPIDDQWELYDLTADPTEADNRWTDPCLHELRQHLRMQLKQARATSVPERNQPWPYAVRRPPTAEHGRVRLPPSVSAACSADFAGGSRLPICCLPCP